MKTIVAARDEVQALDVPFKTAPKERASQEAIQASYLAHELRAPLTSINLTMELLREQLQDRLQQDERQLFNIALKNIDRLAGLINDVLDFSRMKSGRLSFDLKNEDPGALIIEAVKSLETWAVSKGIALRCDSEDALPMVRADARRIVQVLVNLVSNAIKFTPPGGRIEAAAAKGCLDCSGSVVFRVRDTGCGIPEGDGDRIFRAFEQSASGVKSSGAGLGLTLAKAMVEGHGGRIWVESAPGGGSAFYFTLPQAY